MLTEESPLRLGIVDYLNAWPLAWGFLAGPRDPRFRVSYLPPAQVAAQLRSGELDAGLIPSIEVPRIGSLKMLPGMCVASVHEVRSVVLVSQKPVEEWRRVALDANSRTSAALVEILLKERYGRSPQFVEASPDLERMLDDADAALVIGDPALRIDRSRYQIWDLAAEWREMTGRPFVFAVWAVRQSVASEIQTVLARTLEQSRDRGLAEMERVVERAVSVLGLGRELAQEYLNRNLSYALDERALQGLTKFYELAESLALITSADHQP